FLDELPEFGQYTLETLRQPLESGVVTIARAAGVVTFPARVPLAAARHPGPCGFLGDSVRPCRCSDYAVRRYRRRLSGPLLDRIDIHLEVPGHATCTIPQPPAQGFPPRAPGPPRACPLIPPDLGRRPPRPPAAGHIRRGGVTERTRT